MNLVSSPVLCRGGICITDNSSAATHFLHPIPILVHVLVTTVLPTSAQTHRGTLADQSGRHAATHCCWPEALQESKNFGQNNPPWSSYEFRYRTDHGTAFWAKSCQEFAYHSVIRSLLNHCRKPFWQEKVVGWLIGWLVGWVGSWFLVLAAVDSPDLSSEDTQPYHTVPITSHSSHSYCII